MRMIHWVWIAAVFSMTGCAALQKAPSPVAAPPESPEITQILQDIRQANSGLSTFKGTGKLKLRKNNQLKVLYSAWSSARPDKIRIVIQAIAGYPVASMAADGKWLYLLSYNDDSFYKAEVRDPDLEKLVSVPVTAADVISLLSGVIPVRPYWSSDLSRPASEDGYVLSLKREGGADVEKIYLDASQKRVVRVEMFTPQGKPSYRVEMSGEITVDGFEVPSRFVFSSGDQAGFELDLDRFWPNTPASPDMFVITP